MNVQNRKEKLASNAKFPSVWRPEFRPKKGPENGPTKYFWDGKSKWGLEYGTTQTSKSNIVSNPYCHQVWKDERCFVLVRIFKRVV